MKLKTFLLVITMAFALSSQVCAHQFDSTSTISLITCSPGREIYELEGHTALRIHDTTYDYIVNWGVFDFESPHFIYRFIKGDTDYLCEIVPTSEFVRHYYSTGRMVMEQVLDLTKRETETLIANIQINLQPQNKVYRYNYIKDNCALRPLKIISNSLSDTLILSKAPTQIVGENSSYRSIMRVYHRNYPWYQFGIDLALGNGIDRILIGSEPAFAPEILYHMLNGATVGERKVVKQTNILSKGTKNPLQSITWHFTPIIVSLLYLAMNLVVTWNDIRRKQVTRWFDAINYSIFGIIGCVIAFLVFISTHEATSPNIVILWLNPFCITVTICIWYAKLARFLYVYYYSNIVSITLMVLLIPITGQSLNIAFFPIILSDLMRSFSFLYITKNRNDCTK